MVSPGNKNLNYILATDVGSTTTKARFFHKRDGVWRFYVAGEAPTTVEAPYEDVTLGVTNAVREVEELTGHQILEKDGSGIKVPFDGESGVDLYCTTSSAGGGLQMMVGGLVKTMTAESANRAALGAGSIVMDILSVDDGRENYERIKKIRSLRPDMILLAGGTDGGDIQHVVELAELIKSARPQPRLGVDYNLPLVYAGNKDAREYIRELAEDTFALNIVDNIRPVLEMENTDPARRAIHELFMEHVMSHAPGYTRLMKWANIDIMPTPAAEGLAIKLIAETYKKNAIGVGLGGATTNIYSVFDDRFVRSVSANLGMSYSITNVLKEAGIERQSKKKKVYKVKRGYYYKGQDTYIGIFPAEKYKINYLLKYDHPVIGTEYFEYEFEKESFINEIMPARTFGFAKEVAMLKERGLALGGSLDNAVLIEDNNVVNELRFKDEFVRHKVLDLVGDLYLNGPLIGEIIAIRTGHTDNYKLNQMIQKKKK